MLPDLDQHLADAAAAVGGAGDLDALRALDADLLGKASVVTEARRSLEAMEPDERKDAGRRLNEVRAELDVATVVIYGTVYGNIRASNCVELHAGGQLVGNIVSPSLVVERGANFDGNCRMGAVQEDSEGEETVLEAPAQAEA